MSGGPVVELESNTAYGVSEFEEAFYDNPANFTLTGKEFSADCNAS